MSTLAYFRRIARSLPGRALLAWFMLTLAVATAAPLAHTAPLQDICTSAGATSLMAGVGGTYAPAAHLDCPLCLPTAPPPARWQAPPAPQPAPLHRVRWALLEQATQHADRTPPVRAPPPL